MNTEHLTINLVTVGVELLVVIALLAILSWSVRRTLRWLTSMPSLRRLESGATVLRDNIRLLVLGVGLLLCLGILGGNGYLMYRGENVLDFTRAQVERIPKEFWVDLGVGIGKVVGLVVVVMIVLRMARRLLDFLGARAKAFEGIRANDESLDQLFDSLKKIVGRSAWIVVLALSARWLGLPEIVYSQIMLALRIYLIIAAGLLIWRALDAVIDSLDALSKKYSSPDNWLRFYDKLTHLVPLFRRAVEWVLYVTVGTLVVLQVEAFANLAEWGPRLIRIIGIAFIARFVIEVTNLLVEEMLLKRAELTTAQRQRRLTIVPLLRSALKYLIYFTAAIFVLKQLQIDPTPVLAGAGIVTLAVGLGAQNLINDIVSGFFILFENYYLVGDFIKVKDVEGVVEAIDLRATRIRDNRGRLNIIRNGMIEDVTNFSKTYTKAVVDVGVAYESDLDDVYAALEEVGRRLPDVCSDTLAPLEVKGLVDFGESELTIRTATRVKPGMHIPSQAAIRKLTKEVFDERGIEIPYARRVLIVQSPADEQSLSTALGPTT